MKIEREIITSLLEWKNNPNRKPLILQGARQTGKTWLMKHFGEQYFSNVAYFNFEENAELCNEFEQTKDIKRLLSQLALYTDVAIKEKETLLIFDEIQECNAALNSLKYFCENAPQFAIMAAGSLLGVSLSKGDSFPVGKIEFLTLFPLAFKEFLKMDNLKIYQFLEDKTDLESLPEIIFNQTIESFRRYKISGGMPEPMLALLQNDGLEKVQKAQKNILNAYQLDFAKHVEKKDIHKITEVWKSIPSQLSKENRKFLYQVVKNGARAREYESALLWLQNAGLIYRIFSNKKPHFPLCAYDDMLAFKIYLSDIGLLRSLSQLPIEVMNQKNSLYTEFKGGLTENYILQSLVNQFEILPRYWQSNGKAEVDFLIQYKDLIIPIEVKSEQNVSGKSLMVYNELFNPKIRIRYSMKNLKLDGNLLNIPIFLADWSEKFINL